jgi:hypothetical protein
MTVKDLWGQINTISLNLITIVCGGCGIPFAIPENYLEKLKETHANWHCPNGCVRHFTAESEAEKLQRQLRRREYEIAQLSSSKIQLEQQLQKVASGKCPCCNKVYKHLQAHMKNKHPHALKVK